MVNSESIELVLYRWRNNYYGATMKSNDDNAVKAIRELFDHAKHE